VSNFIEVLSQSVPSSSVSVVNILSAVRLENLGSVLCNGEGFLLGILFISSLGSIQPYFQWLT